jgi:UDP-3-O-[3-hydroxymyristoyl] glucosamine N-acyltransferase
MHVDADRSITPDVKLGRNVELGKFVSLYGCEIGDETQIGAFVEIQRDAKRGRRQRRHPRRSGTRDRGGQPRQTSAVPHHQTGGIE